MNEKSGRSVEEIRRRLVRTIESALVEYTSFGQIRDFSLQYREAVRRVENILDEILSGGEVQDS